MKNNSLMPFSLTLFSLVVFSFGCAKEKKQFQSIASAGDFFCATDTSGKIECFRHLYAKVHGSESFVADTSRKFNLDRLQIPKDLQKKSHTDIQMVELPASTQNSHQITSKSKVVVCSNTGKFQCWGYESDRGAMENIHYAVDNLINNANKIYLGAMTSKMDTSYSSIASAFVCTTEQSPSRIDCVDVFSGKSFNVTSGRSAAIKNVFVSSPFCFQENSGMHNNDFYCAEFNSDAHSKSWVPIGTQKQSKKLSNNSIQKSIIYKYKASSLSCFLMSDKSMQCHEYKPTSLKFGSDLTASFTGGLTFNKLSGAFALQSNGKLFQGNYSGGSLSQQTIHPNIVNRTFLDWATGNASACGIDESSKKMSCFMIDPFTNQLISDEITSL